MDSEEVEGDPAVGDMRARWEEDVDRGADVVQTRGLRVSRSALTVGIRR